MTKVTHNEARHRFEIALEDGAMAIADYRRDGNRVVFPHTVVPPAYEGKGLASALAKVSLEWARTERLKVVPACSFYRSYIERHAEFRDLLA